MKILTLTFSLGMGGSERAAVNYAIGYRQFGHDSKVLVMGGGRERLAALQEAGVDVIFLPEQLEEHSIVFAELKKWAPDIIHIHTYHEWFVSRLKQLSAEHTKVVETNIFSRPNYDPGYKMVALSMQLSSWGYWKYCRWMKGAAYSPEVAIVPYSFISKEFAVPQQEEINDFLTVNNIPQGSFVLGRVGQGISAKWDNRIIEVIEHTVKPDNNIYYVFVSAPPDLKEMLKKRSVFIQSRVKLLDPIYGDKKLSLFYYSINCFVHMAKIGESFGYVLAEAMACNVPVITMLTPFKDNAQFEVVGHEYGGICTINTEQFTKAVLYLYNSPEEINRIKKNLTGWVEHRFSLEAVIPAQINYYNCLLEDKKIPQVDVSEVIKGSFKLYGAAGPLYYMYSKIVNHRLAYLLMQKIKKLIK